MHQIVQVLAVATSCLEQINQSMPLLLLLQVLQAWLELQSCHLNSCFTYFILSSNWLLPTFPFPLLFLFLPLIWGNYFIFQGWRFLVFILFSMDFSVKAVIALFTLSLCPFATSNCLSRCLYVPCLFDLHFLVVQFRIWSPVLQSFEAVCRKPAWDLLQRVFVFCELNGINNWVRSWRPRTFCQRKPIVSTEYQDLYKWQLAAAYNC